MRKVKFEYKENDLGGIVYPDDTSQFRDTYVKDGFIYGNYLGSKSSIQNAPLDYIDLEVAVDKHQYAIGEIITFTGEFSDKSLNISIVPITILDRNGRHVDNIGVEVKEGLISGAVKFNKPGDYYISHEGINYHKNIIPIELRLKKEVSFRVYR